MTQKNEKHIAEILESQRPAALSYTERDRVWATVAPCLVPQMVRSPFSVFHFIHYQHTHNSMIALLLGLITIFATGGTVYASDSARPGDFLFPVDRAVENIRVAFASNERRPELTKQFASERLDELRSIIVEEYQRKATTTLPISTTTPVIVRTLAVDAHVYTDTTIIKIELNGEYYLYEPDLRIKEEIITDVASQFSIATSSVAGVIKFTVEDRASRAEDRVINNTLSDHSRARIDAALNVAENFIDNSEHLDDKIRAVLRNDVMNEARRLSHEVLNIHGNKNGREDDQDGGNDEQFEGQNGNRQTTTASTTVRRDEDGAEQSSENGDSEASSDISRRGEDGRDGEDGEDGDDGVKGSDGADGKDGRDGDDGAGSNGGSARVDAEVKINF